MVYVIWCNAADIVEVESDSLTSISSLMSSSKMVTEQILCSYMTVILHDMMAEMVLVMGLISQCSMIV